MTDLLDLIREHDHADDPRGDWVHSTLPDMSYACGGDIARGLPDGGPKGRSILGGWSGRRWVEITCPHCRRWTLKGLALRAHRQQAPMDHRCPEDDSLCSYVVDLPGLTPEQVIAATADPYPTSYWDRA